MKEQEKTSIKPITPAEAKRKHSETIPWFVIAAVNELITEKANQKEFIVLQCNIIDRAIQISNEEASREDFFENHWLDIEDIYRNAGWDVTYEKPAYCENFKARFTFSPAKQ